MAGDNGHKSERYVPGCMICLVISTMTAHSLMFVGTLQFNSNLNKMGQSTKGWSDVGMTLAECFEKELDHDITVVTNVLSDTCGVIVNTTKTVENVISSLANMTDNTIGHINALDQRLANSFLEEPEVTWLTSTGNETPPARTTRRATHMAGTVAAHVAKHGLSAGRFPIVVASVKSKKVELDKQQPNFDSALNGTMNLVLSTVDTQVSKVKEVVSWFLELIRPALEKIGQWLITFGEKLINTMEEFSTIIDRVQKIFDQVMSKFSSGGSSENEDEMIHNTYTLFDTNNDGSVALEDLEDVADLYGLTAFAGEKGEELFRTYDADHNDALDKTEFRLMVRDDSVPSCMSVILRQYAKRLTQVAGNVAAARVRSEVAGTVVEYFNLVCAKNMTKVGWVSQRLTNGSLPLAFTADVLRQLVVNKGNPSTLTMADVGQIVVGEMIRINASHVYEAFDLMQDPVWWLDAGHSLPNQPGYCATVMEWIASAEATQNGSASPLLERFGSRRLLHSADRTRAGEGALLDEKLTLQELLRRLVDDTKDNIAESNAAFENQQREARNAEHDALFASPSAQTLYQDLLGKPVAAAEPPDPDVDGVVNSGTLAKPETLEFAAFLAANASQFADSFQEMSFEYAGTSSSALDSFGTMFQGMLKKITGFLNLMKKYATPRGIENLEGQVQEFLDNAVDDVVLSVQRIIVDSANKAGIVDSVHDAQNAVSNAAKNVESSGVFSMILDVQGVMNSILPTVVENMKFARKEVSAISQTLDSIFSIFSAKGPPIFEWVTSLHHTIFTMYYVLFMVLTPSVLFYAFWATGWFGGEHEPLEYQAPRSFGDRCRVCCSSCLSCVKSVHDSNLCFWSVLLLLQVVILLMFIFSILLVIVSGVQALLSAGCGEIYLLGDPSICNNTLGLVRKFLTTFMPGISDPCSDSKLVTCQYIGSELTTILLMTVGGSMVAAILSFQLLVESARMHEMERWKRMLQEVGLNKT